MNHHVPPGGDIYGGIKVGVQFGRLLTEAGLPMAVASTRNLPPSWFRCSQPVASRYRIAVQRKKLRSVMEAGWKDALSWS